KGVKFRSPQGMTAEILTKLGASIVVLPGGEVYSALDKGVVDAADWATVSMNQRMGFHEIAKYPTKLFHSMPIQEFTVNMDAWKKLPDDLKALLHTAVREWTWDQVQRIAVDDLRVVRELAAKGIKAAQWPESEMVKIRALAHRRHVRIDVIYDRLSPRTRAKLDLFTFVFFFIYVAGLIWVGSTLAWGSFLEGEGTGTPWNPRIWPVKFAIPIAGVLLLLQG